MVATWAISVCSLTFLLCLAIASTTPRRLVDAALEAHRVGAGGDVLQAFAVDRLGQQRRRRRAVAGDVAGLAGDFAHHLRAHVLERIGQLDFLGDRHAVLGDRRRAELLVEDHVAAAGPSVTLTARLSFSTPPGSPGGVAVILQLLAFAAMCLFSSLVCGLLLRRLVLDDAEDVFLAHDLVFLVVHLDFGAAVLRHQHLVALLDVERDLLAVSSRLPVPTAMTLPSWGFSLAVSGMMIPPFLTFAFLERLHQHAISQRLIFMLCLSPWFGFRPPYPARPPPGPPRALLPFIYLLLVVVDHLEVGVDHVAFLPPPPPFSAPARPRPAGRRRPAAARPAAGCLACA
jgi:hypothetical protein